MVNLDVLLSSLANDHFEVAQKITRLLIPSYFPSRVKIEEACNRCVTLMKRAPMACARFCEFALLEGVPLNSLMELAKAFTSLVLSHENLEANQVEGLLVAVACLCKSLRSDPACLNSLKELFSADKVKCLFAAASAGRAQSSVFDIVSTVSPDNVVGILKDCMGLVSNCTGLSENVERQAEVRSAHKLLLSCYAFDEMLEALTKLLQKTAYRCHVKFGTEMPKLSVSSAKRKKSKSSAEISAKWKHVSRKMSSDFEEEYSIAVGIAWQVKDLLTSEDSRKAILGSPCLEPIFLALKVISEVSILQCTYCDYMDAYPILAYTSLALQMSILNTGICDPTRNDGTESSKPTSEASNTLLAPFLLNSLFFV